MIDYKERLSNITPMSYKNLCGDKQLADYIKTYHISGNPLLLTAFLLRDGKLNNYMIDCEICGKQFKTVLTNRGRFGYKTICSNSCELVRRHRDPEYSKNISVKALDTKNNTIIDGMNMNQIGAIRSAITTAQRYTKEERSRQLSIGTKNFYEKTLHTPIRNRIQKIIEYYGVDRAIILAFRLSHRKRTYALFNLYVDKVFTYMSMGYTIEQRQASYTKMMEIKFTNNCKLCGANYSVYVFTDNTLRKLTNSNYCSPSCCSIDTQNTSYMKLKRSTIMKRLWGNDDYRQRQISNLHTRWKTYSGKAWSKKMLETLGEEGIKQRTLSATMTKLERGIINMTRPVRNEEYRVYKNEVIRITKENKILLENIHLIGKKNHHVDHIFPVSRGFAYKIPAALIGSIQNLNIIPHTENRKKSNNFIEIPPHIYEWFDANDKESLTDILNEIEKYKII